MNYKGQSNRNGSSGKKPLWNNRVARRVTLLSALVITTQFAVPAEAATTIHVNRTAFEAELVSSFTDTYGVDSGYSGSFAVLSNAAMSAVAGQTQYITTGFNNLNIVGTGYYCAGCNGSFTLDFTGTSYTRNGGVYGAGVDILFNAGGYHDALVSFGDGSSALYNLAAGQSFWGITSSSGIARISFGPNGQSTQSGSFGIDNLSIGSVPEPGTWMLLIAGFGMVGFGLRRRPLGVTPG